MARGLSRDETDLTRGHVDVHERGILIVRFSQADIHVARHQRVSRSARADDGRQYNKEVTHAYVPTDARWRTRGCRAQNERRDHTRDRPHDLVLVIVRYLRGDDSEREFKHAVDTCDPSRRGACMAARTLGGDTRLVRGFDIGI